MTRSKPSTVRSWRAARSCMSSKVAADSSRDIMPFTVATGSKRGSAAEGSASIAVSGAPSAPSAMWTATS